MRKDCQSVLKYENKIPEGEKTLKKTGRDKMKRKKLNAQNEKKSTK